MEPTQPLSIKKRKIVFTLLVLLFIIVLPFLYLYATGYKLNLDATDTFVSTGGIYVAADRTGAEIYIDDELVRETRAFRRAFYAQGLETGTHKVHVQKPESHTWVKELPVYPHVVTEAQAFNMPLVPQVRVISAHRTAAGETVLPEEPIAHASTTNEYVLEDSLSPTVLLDDTEHQTLVQVFDDEAVVSLPSRIQEGIDSFLSSEEATTTATTTKVANGVALYESEGYVYARYVGEEENMPYYYCAPEYELLSEEVETVEGVAFADTHDDILLDEAPMAEVCDPTIQLDDKEQIITAFDFYPGSSDIVILALEDGIYVVEIDDRGWQNMQPLLLGDSLDMRVYNGGVYALDGAIMYQILLNT
ncbi:hypothetical protein KTR10_03565 [Candidatus Kaiserbacteria bacterium]|nr:hypothetical protein [Candidatus Kaiserbacteria bacterium]